ncbi:hypothetical protein [Nostoc sp.]|uniref:hypothetical protein n=1 Tax=Nostoc sp. TaxID=1180 RepID=UPI002FF4FEA5
MLNTQYNSWRGWRLGRSYAAAFTTPAPSSVPLRGSKLRVASLRVVEMLSTSAQCPNKITYAP